MVQGIIETKVDGSIWQCLNPGLMKYCYRMQKSWMD